MPEENRVFDISKPGSTGPHPASKPVIVGHHPIPADPMFKDRSPAPAPTHILVQDAPHHQIEADKPSGSSQSMFSPAALASEAASHDHSSESYLTGDGQHHDDVVPPSPTGPSDYHNDEHHDDAAHVVDSDSADAADKPAPADSQSIDPHIPLEHLNGVEGIHLPPRKHGNKMLKVLLIIVLLAVAGYLFIDSDVVNTGINLPFHIFKQKSDNNTASTTPPPAAPAPAAAQTAVPDGFTQYNITGTNISFASPTEWGKPDSSIDKGFASRTDGAQPDSNYAYVVDFPNNKGVELAVTSSKFLPPARTPLYYDYLQWCTGTNDSKYYFSVLKFTTTDKVDTPSTVTCDQLPSVVPTKLDDTTLVQTAVKSTDGKTVGDIYTENLTDKDLPVIHVLDINSQNSDNIKKLLANVKVQ